MAKQDMAELGFSGVKELDSTEDKNTESIEHWKVVKRKLWASFCRILD